MSRVVLITGCSTGIGRDLAQRLAQAGYHVVATARKPETLQDLQVALKLPLDVTQPESIQQAVDVTLKQFGRIDVLVNNAGISVRGAVEEIPDEEIQQIYDVNVFGLLRMVRAVAPQMRKQGGGYIINITSIVGKMSTPVNGVYSSTKFAVEALSDALRMEMAGFGIKVVLVEPGAIITSFDDTARARGQAIFFNPASPYHPLYQNFERFIGGLRPQAAGPEVVSKVVQQAIELPQPKARYMVAVTLPIKLLRWMSDPIRDFLIKRLLKIRVPTTVRGG